MTRVRNASASRHRRNKVLKLTKGHRGARHSLYRIAHESMLKALSYAYRHRRERKRDMRRLWICRINAAARLEGVSYSQFMDRLRKSGIETNRKILAELAVSDPQAFSKILAQAQG